MHILLLAFHFNFSSDNEKNLVKLLIKFARQGFPLMKGKVRSLAYEYAEMNGQEGFSKITKWAGHTWLKLFLKCYPEVRVKKGHNLSVNHAMCANPPTIDKFFALYKKLLTQLNIESPMCIWNCDESRVQDVPKEEEVIGVTGEKTHTITPKEQGETTTILTFTNACGQVMPPLVIHKAQKCLICCC